MRQGGTLISQTDPWIQLDGRLNAPAGTPQFPTLLNTYHDTGIPDGRYSWPSTRSAIGGNLTQPPWKVAGVDYHVGIDRNLYPLDSNLKDPASLPNGSTFTVDTTNKVLTLLLPNTTVDGYDFSLAGGWQVVPTNANQTISNSKWVMGSVHNTPIWAHTGVGVSNLTVINCEFNGSFDATNVAQNVGVLVRTDGPQMTMRYCYLQNSSGDDINFTFGDFLDVRFSLFKDNGTINAHPDWISFGGPQATPYGPCTVNFNTWWQSPNVQNGTQGIGIAGDAGSSLRGMNEVAYNTMLNLGGNGTNTSFYMVSYDFTQYTAGTSGKCHDNFIDPTWVGGGSGTQDFTQWTAFFVVGTSTTTFINKNTNMLTGAIDAFLFPRGTAGEGYQFAPYP